MSKAPTMPLFTDAYISDTMHLTTEEHGAYFLLLLATWRNNGVALEDDDKKLSRIVRASPHKWRKLRPTLIRFFDISDGYWHQKKLESTWESTSKKIDEKKERFHKNILRESKPNSLKPNDSPLHKPLTINHKPLDSAATHNGNNYGKPPRPSSAKTKLTDDETRAAFAKAFTGEGA